MVGQVGEPKSRQKGGMEMKALNILQKSAYGVVEKWLSEQMASRRIIYMSDCPVPELKHLPIRGLVAMVGKLNGNFEVSYKYKIGSPNGAKEQDVRNCVIAERTMGLSDNEDGDINGR